MERIDEMMSLEMQLAEDSIWGPKERAAEAWPPTPAANSALCTPKIFYRCIFQLVSLGSSKIGEPGSFIHRFGKMDDESYNSSPTQSIPQ
jgi:hypothetical protein